MRNVYLFISGMHRKLLYNQASEVKFFFEIRKAKLNKIILNGKKDLFLRNRVAWYILHVLVL